MPDHDERQVEVLRTAYEVIRRRPDMYFSRGVPTVRNLIRHFAEDLACRSQGEFTTAKLGRFGLVAADFDWLVFPKTELPELFVRFLPSPRGLPNDLRAEVLVGVASDGILCGGSAGLRYSRGLIESDVPASLLTEATPWARWMIWRLEPRSNWGSTPTPRKPNSRPR